MADTNFTLTSDPLIPTCFRWRYGGQNVFLIGSFTRWLDRIRLIPVDGNPGFFSVVLRLVPGYHEYKFIVDGLWRHDEYLPTTADPNGNVNNLVFVPHQEPKLGNYLMSSQLFFQAINPRPPPPQIFGPEDVTMGDRIPHLPTERTEPEYTLHVIHDFLHAHKAFELIPESGKVVVLDVDLSVRQAFHALYEQGIASAPLWDSEEKSIVGVISASDFIHALKRLRDSVTTGIGAVTTVEMDRHTIRQLKQEVPENGERHSERLVYVEPEMRLDDVVRILIEKHCSMAPIVTPEEGRKIPKVLHTATLGGILSCLLRHFQASISSLPFLSRPLTSLNLGTWSPNAPIAPQPYDEDGRRRRRADDLEVVHPETPLIEALTLLLESDLSSVPIVDQENVLLDVYARSDITQLANNHIYTRLLLEDMPIYQVLGRHRETSIPESNSGHIVGGLTASLRGGTGSGSGSQWISSSSHARSVTRNDTLRTVVERLAQPGVQRLMVVDPDSRCLEGVISLTDIARYLFVHSITHTTNQQTH